MLKSANRGEQIRWARDKALLGVASKARQARFARATKDLG
jgi:hypothetical protein